MAFSGKAITPALRSRPANGKMKTTLGSYSMPGIANKKKAAKKKNG